MKKYIIFMAVFIVAFALAWLIKPVEVPMATHAKKKVLYWVAPMNPSYRKDKPGKSPMGMDLVPVYQETEKEERQRDYIQISSRVINNLSVVIRRAQYKVLAKEITTVGYVVANKDNIESVHSYVDGWIRNAKVSSVGDSVKKGQVLFQLYSPTLVSAQQELLLALKNNGPRLINASEQKLLTLGLNKAQIREIKDTRKIKQQIDIYSKSDGIISMLDLRDGMYIKPGKNLMVVKDLSSIWVRVEVPEQQSEWVKNNQSAIASFSGLPGQVWQGNIIYIYPRLNKMTHTLAVRLKFPNPNLLLKLNMYADVKIFVPNTKQNLVVPVSAIIRNGDGNHVILSLGNGRFKPQWVTLGTESNGEVAILKGLSEGDEVVVSGQFLIDSESNLSAAFDRLNPYNPSKNKPMHKKMKMKHKLKANVGQTHSINSPDNRIMMGHSPKKTGTA